MKDQFYYILKQCLDSRQDWAKYQKDYLRFQSLKEEANKRRFTGNLLILFIYKLINLPLIITNFLIKVNQYSQYHKVLSEIEVMQEEINKYEVLIVCAGMEGALATVLGGLLPQPIIAVPVLRSFNISFKVLLNLFSKTSSKLLAKLNLEKGLYSNDKVVCFLKGNTNLSKSLSFNLITRTLLEF